MCEFGLLARLSWLLRNLNVTCNLLADPCSEVREIIASPDKRRDPEKYAASSLVSPGVLSFAALGALPLLVVNFDQLAPSEDHFQADKVRDVSMIISSKELERPIPCSCS